jgi:hypothetical protein
LDSDEFFEYLYRYINENIQNNQIRFDYSVFGFDNKGLGEIQIISKEEWKKKRWNKIQQRIKLLNAIGIYWIGYPYEKDIAKKYLIEKTGKDFKAADKYFIWWIKKNYKTVI